MTMSMHGDGEEGFFDPPDPGHKKRKRHFNQNGKVPIIILDDDANDEGCGSATLSKKSLSITGDINLPVTQVDAPCKIDIIDLDVVEICGLCMNAVDEDFLFTTRCRHKFCVGCLKDNLLLQIETAKQRLFLLCPFKGCTAELRSNEASTILGSDQFRAYTTMFASCYEDLYAPVLNKSSRIICKNGMCNQEIPSAILATKVKMLTSAELLQALDVRSVVTKYVQAKRNVKLLLDAIGWEDQLPMPVWVCVTCDGAWCGLCGVQFPVLRDGKNAQGTICHNCEEKHFEIFKTVTALNEAYSAYNIVGRQEEKGNAHSPNLRARNVVIEREQIRPKGTGFGGSCVWAKGTGFCGAGSGGTKHNASLWKDDSKKAEGEIDKRVVKALDFFINVFKDDIPASIFGLLCWKDIVQQVLLYLAANDSMLDISERSALYFKFVDFLNNLKHQRELCNALLRKPCGDGKSNNLLLQKMENIYKQSKVMLHNINVNDEVVEVDIGLARELSDCYESLSVSEAHLGKTISSIGESAKRSSYVEKLKTLQFRLVSMRRKDGGYNHYFNNNVLGNTGSLAIDSRGIHNHKRVLHISKEIASLATTLPLEWESSIHLCVDEERMDVLKALIIGPCGTPYANGIFIFDILLPPDYPHVPPQVQFLTTGGGAVRFNPNLYADGKVCLSLLGTWSGPGWLPGKSTLLQVLVSIQSLIFVSDPYYNEPGREYSSSNSSAEAENMRHRANTLSVAILGALRSPEVLFEQVIYEHFQHKRFDIERQCDEWVALATKSKKSSMKATAKEIKQLLQKRFPLATVLWPETSLSFWLIVMPSGIVSRMPICWLLLGVRWRWQSGKGLILLRLRALIFRILVDD